MTKMRRGMQSIRSLSVRWTLALLVTISALPIALSATFLAVKYFELEQREDERILLLRAQTISARIEREVRELQAALIQLSLSEDLNERDLAGFQGQAVDVLSQTEAQSIQLMDLQGQLLMSTRLPVGSPLPKMASPPVLELTLKPQRPGISDLVVSPFSQKLVLVVSVPVIRGRQMVYSLAATISPNRIEQILIEQNLPLSWRASVIDGTGRVIARSREHLTYVGKEVSNLTRERIAGYASNSKSYMTVNWEGIPVLAILSQSSLMQWTILLSIPPAELTTALQEASLLFIWSIVILFVTGLMCAWVIGGQVAKTIKTVSQAAVLLSRGEVISLPPLFTQEGMALRKALMGASLAAERSRHTANHDGLTGMPNRGLFEFFVTQQLARCHRQHSVLAVLFIDLDGFKAINDNFGHAVGDQVLVAVAQRMQLALRGSDLAARLGGDEFALVLMDAEPENAKAFSKRLIETISQVYLLNGIEAHISASVGVACYPYAAADCGSLLVAADKAMYQAKAQGKRQVCVASD